MPCHAYDHLFRRIVHTNTPLLSHRASPPLAEIGLLSLGLGDTLGESLSVFISGIFGSLSITTLERDAMTLMLQTLRSDQALNLRRLGIRLLALAFRLDLTTDNKLADIIILGEAKELPNLCRAFGTQALRVHGVGDAGDVVVALFDDREG